MSAIELLAANITCPENDAVAVFTTSLTSAITTLSATEHLGALASSGHYMSVMADGGDVVAYFVSAAGSRTVSLTSITKATRGWKFKDGVEVPFRLTRTAAGVLRTKIVHACSAASSRLRIRMSSAHSTDEVTPR
jgi:hypothetical protein